MSHDAYFCEVAAEAGDEYVILERFEHDEMASADGADHSECTPLEMLDSGNPALGRYLAGEFVRLADSYGVLTLDDDDHKALAADDAGEMTFLDADGVEQYASDWVTGCVEDAQSAFCRHGFYVEWHDGAYSILRPSDGR